MDKEGKDPYRHLKAKLLVNHFSRDAIALLAEVEDKNGCIERAVERILTDLGLEFHDAMMKVKNGEMGSYLGVETRGIQGHGPQRYSGQPSPPQSQSSPLAKHEPPVGGGPPLSPALTNRSPRERPGFAPDVISVLTGTVPEILTAKRISGPNNFVCAEALRRFSIDFDRAPAPSGFRVIHDDARGGQFSPHYQVKLTYTLGGQYDLKSDVRWFYVVDNLQSVDVLMGDASRVPVPHVYGTFHTARSNARVVSTERDAEPL
jgi:hypothetical protein